MGPSRSLRPIAALIAAGIAAGLLLAPLPAAADTKTVCTLEPGYELCGRAFPDPQGGLGLDPNEEGRFPTPTFIQWGMPGQPGMSQIWDGLSLLERRYDRFLEVWQLHELLDDPNAMSAGLWAGSTRERQPLILARVTDESVPAKHKRRFVFGLSLHGIERAGVEGGTRALEDLVTYAYCESLGDLAAARADAICALQNHVKRGAYVDGEGGFPARLLPWDGDSMTMGEVLKHAELYFTYNNPDGWHRGDLPAFGGVAHYQRYNGNGIDLNRDWPTKGYTFWPYTPNSEPETRAFVEALKSMGGNWASGIDLHGQGCAPVLTYTMLPAGQHDYAKNQRIRAIAERTQQDGQERLAWSYFIEGGDPPSLPAPGIPLLCGISTRPMGAQQWGTVWDTINYTITGSYGDWMNNPDIGLGAIGMDNEMSLSHVTNCGVGSCFLPDIEQLHVAGNKGLIYADIDTTLRTERTDYRFPMRGRGAYLDHGNVVRAGADRRAIAALKLPAQVGISGNLPCTGVLGGSLTREFFACSQEFEVLGASDGVYNGGITADIGYMGTHSSNDTSNAHFAIERFVTDHEGEGGEWVEVQRHYNEQQLYLTNGATLTVNAPIPGRYRLYMFVTNPGVYSYTIDFSRGDAHDDPGQAAFRASNLDFFAELDPFVPASKRFRGLTAGDIAADPGALDEVEVLVLADEALPGWNFAKPARSKTSHKVHRRYFDALRDWVRRGGTLVLTDAALQGLADLTGRPKLKADRTTAFAGFVGFNDGNAPTYDDPLAAKINVPGAAEGSGNRHQTYEPVPLGFDIRDGDTGQRNSPIWTVNPLEFDKAGGRVVGIANGGVTLGEIRFGRGAIRIAGALLPTPTTEFDHPFGLSSYALTWTGWQLIENLVAPVGTVAPRPKVLSAADELPKTGLTAGWIILVLALAGAALIMRRLRDSSLI